MYSEKKLIPFILLSLLVVLVYCNTFNASWHLDDFQNIKQNKWITIDNLYPQTLLDTFRASYDGGEYKQKKIYRPFPMLTFALNWYIGGEDTTVYHITNILIHILSAFFLYLAIRKLFQSPALKNRYTENLGYNAALFAAAVWAIHPIQTQAVTYIVQRMASMAGMFFIISIYLYLKGRLSNSAGYKKTIIYFTSFATYLMAVYSKQNTVLLPFSLILIEVLFFQSKEIFKIKKKFVLWSVLSFIIILLASFVFLDTDFYYLLEGYERRPFDLTQRVLTESRILCFHIFQLFYPISSVYSISHSFELSENLIEPVSTLFSVLFICFAIGAGLFYKRKYPELSFSVLFFFLNHLIESTVLPLELIFEHRNYIPSMFIFLPLSIIVFLFLENFKEAKVKYIFYSSSITALIIAVGLGTYTRNFDWLTDKDLWEDALNKAPNNARPYHNLSGYYWNTHQYEEFYELNKKALNLYMNRIKDPEMISYSNISKFYLKKKEYDKALEYAKKAFQTYSTKKTLESYLNVLLTADKLVEADYLLEKVLYRYRNIPNILNINTITMLKNKKYDKAYESSLKAFKIDPFSEKSILYLGYSCYAQGNIYKAFYYFDKALKKNIINYDRVFVYFIMIQEYSSQNNLEEKNSILEEFFNNTSLKQAEIFWDTYNKQKYPILKLDQDIIIKELTNYYLKKMEKLNL
jgi:hypothetical protein